ncbi:hypothetical protein A3E45_01190 [Candidatus Daviesbacteria bacterium RIFCSPHIGHO2_12_FULL_43_11]|uniref:ArnT-like N-terminal domain-containing protein n=2 Tax=Candidatus Daviesiibacteriota TaxID=1752718 RepID=A0A1F5K6U4_9BACT|nr:MAG: Glycosyl transferase family 39 [Candidatus Daviesbacteria bacterium GW2011_GWA1_42_6]OGE36518.1 MAG: hypothetical protein A3E45_01190 [Candidatus Daviesbacteria bacterium RIFCSPHIGHO2_12_FULL_43_11]
MKIHISRLSGLRESRRLLLIAILIISALFRFIGTNPGYPPIHTDEGITHYQGLSIILKHSLDPVHNNTVNKFDYLVYPVIVPLVNAIFYLFVFIPVYSLGYLIIHIGDLPSLLRSSPDQLWSIISTNIFGPSRVNVIFWGRYVTALFGVGVVLMSYLLSKQLFRSVAIALSTAFLVAINYRQVLNSHFGLPDIYNAFFLLLALWIIAKLINQQTRLNYILTGFAVALSFSTKFFFYIFIPLFVAVTFYSLKSKSTEKFLKTFFKIDHLLMISVALCVIIILGVYHLIYWPETIKQLNYLSLRNRAGTMALDIFAISYLYNIMLGPLTTILIILGIFYGIIRRFFVTFLLLSLLIPFLFFLLYYSQAGSSPRNFVTITPLLLMFSSLGIYSIWNFLLKYSKFLAVFFCAFIMIIITSEALRNSLVVPIEYSKTWNYKLAQNWLGKNLPEKSTILAYHYAPLPSKNLRVTEVKSPADYSLAEMQDQEIGWAFINTEWMSDSFFWWMNQDTLTSLKLWNKPTAILSNSPLAKSILELKQFIVFEALNPWQAPDNNFLVVKVPGKITFTDGLLIKAWDFSFSGWEVVNDNFGETSSFTLDTLNGKENLGSLKIAQSNNPLYSQRFLSDKILVTEGKVYKIKGFIRSSENLPWEKRDGYLGLDFFSDGDEIIGTALSARIYGSDKWVEREFVTKLPEGTKSLRLTFQVGVFDKANFWLDDVTIWESKEQYFQDENKYIQSKFDLDEHLFLNSNGGM